MSVKHDQSGFGHVVLVLVVLVVGVIGLSAYEVVNANNKVAVSSDTATASSPHTVTVPKTITSQSSLEQADQALSESNQQAQSQLDSTSLNSSINSML